PAPPEHPREARDERPRRAHALRDPPRPDPALTKDGGRTPWRPGRAAESMDSHGRSRRTASAAAVSARKGEPDALPAQDTEPVVPVRLLEARAVPRALPPARVRPRTRARRRALRPLHPQSVDGGRAGQAA